MLFRVDQYSDFIIVSTESTTSCRDTIQNAKICVRTFQKLFATLSLSQVKIYLTIFLKSQINNSNILTIQSKDVLTVDLHSEE